MDRQRRILLFSLVLGALLMLGIGVHFLLAGESWGWIVVGFAALDLATAPVTVRFITRNAERAREAEAVDPASDRSYNPYARED